MKVDYYPYSDFRQFSKRDLSYIAQDKNLEAFIEDWPSIESLIQGIERRKQFPVDRTLLHEVLSEQYTGIQDAEAVRENIHALLSENTYCIVTAHQPSLLTGPLYYIYKICSVIALCNKLNAQAPDYQFVPVFVSGGEDHDFDEVNHLRMFNKTITWDHPSEGSVGNFDLTGLPELLEEVKEILGNGDHASQLKNTIDQSLAGSKTYGDFTFRLCHHLMGQYGLVFFNMDHPKLKARIRPILSKEIFEEASFGLVTSTMSALEKYGFKGQANPREINVFYRKEGFRDRIVKTADGYEVVNQHISFTQEELAEELENNPQNFSPNVIVRPLYQEYILPNLAYVGGGGELAYWQERKTQFEQFGVFFPILIRRNSALYVDKGSIKSMNKFNIGIADSFHDPHQLIKNMVSNSSNHELDLSEEKKQLQEIFTKISEKAKAIEATQEKAVLAEMTKQIKSVNHIESKLLRLEKQKHESSIQKVTKTLTKLFPGDNLQERKDNFIPIYLKHGTQFFDTLIENFDPLERVFTVVLDED